jgi:CheY-like chemotaxis protein
MSDESALILVVDDNEMNRDMLSRRLERQGYKAVAAEDGIQALQMVPSQPFDLILLDIMMPRMNGYEVLEKLKADPNLRHIPIIMISAVDDLDSVVKCVEMGADDYLFKPFNPILLKARISASLEKKRLRDQEQKFLQAAQTGAAGESVPIIVHPAEQFDSATLLSARITGLGESSASLSPAEIVNLLNHAFAEFDRAAGQHGLYRAGVMGDTYLAVSGAPQPNPDHAVSAAALALDMRKIVGQLRIQSGQLLSLQAGLHTGSVLGGMVSGQYAFWGDAVLIATQTQMEAPADTIQITEKTYAQLGGQYRCEARGQMRLPGGGSTNTYILKPL